MKALLIISYQNLSRYLQFSILMGRNSATGSCPSPSNPGQGVLIEYSVNGRITWNLLKHISFNSNRKPRYKLICISYIKFLLATDYKKKSF